MKIIKLRVPRVVDGIVRQPAEGFIAIDDDIAQGFLDEKLADEAEDLGDDEDSDNDLDGKTAAQLRDVAVAEEVDLAGATTKPAIIAAIRAKRASPSE